MSGKRVMIGQSEWTLADETAADTVKQIKSALEDGTVAEVSLLDGSGSSVTVFINGKATSTVAVDLGEGPRPSEIS